MLRPNAFSRKLDGAISKIPDKFTFLAVRAVKESVWSAFERTDLFTYLDRREHEHNLAELTRRWGGTPRSEMERNELLSESLRTS